MKKNILKKISAALLALLIMSAAFCAVHAEETETDPKDSKIKGDINLDLRVTMADIYAFRYYLHGMLKIDRLDNADMDSNGNIDIVDFVLMKSAVEEQENSTEEVSG